MVPKPSNLLLAALSRDDRALLAPHLEPVALKHHQTIERPNIPIPHVYFPISGIISIVAKFAGDCRIEAGLAGREGMSGLSVVLGDARSPHETYVQVAGDAERISTPNLRAAIEASVSLHHLFLKYALSFMVQVSHTALANGRSKIDARLARWLLMARDRQDTNEIALTHDFMALMLGVRRPGVTTALDALRRKGAIASKRGRVEIINRVVLESVAGGAYGVPEAEYQRLMGTAPMFGRS